MYSTKSLAIHLTALHNYQVPNFWIKLNSILSYILLFWFWLIWSWYWVIWYILLYYQYLITLFSIFLYFSLLSSSTNHVPINAFRVIWVAKELYITFYNQQPGSYSNQDQQKLPHLHQYYFLHIYRSCKILFVTNFFWYLSTLNKKYYESLQYDRDYWTQ